MDYELLLWLLKNGKSILFLDEKISLYRCHSDSKTVSKETEMVREKMKVQREYGPEHKWLWAIRFIKHQIKTLFI
jgi:hypothetical protein